LQALRVTRCGWDAGQEQANGFTKAGNHFPDRKWSSSPGNHIDRPKQLSLFEAVRMWTNDEGIPFDIVDAGNRLTQAQIQDIAHSEAYKAKLLAFDERR
jgi:hypothetical protein